MNNNMVPGHADAAGAVGGGDVKWVSSAAR